MLNVFYVLYLDASSFRLARVVDKINSLVSHQLSDTVGEDLDQHEALARAILENTPIFIAVFIKIDATQSSILLQSPDETRCHLDTF